MIDVLSPNLIRSISERAKCLYSLKEIEQALEKMAIHIHADLQEKDPIVLCVMIGGITLTGKLLTLLDFPMQVDYIHATRYGANTVGSTLNWLVTPRVSLKGRTVLIVDDILDHGITLSNIINYCQNEGAYDIRTAVLVEKNVFRPKEAVQKAHYTAITVEDRYVFGYGMDYKGYLRNAPGIYALAKEDE